MRDAVDRLGTDQTLSLQSLSRGRFADESLGHATLVDALG